MILADTSIWIDHFRSFNAVFYEFLNRGEVCMHPFVTAELALGFLSPRSTTLALLDELPAVPVARLDEVRHLIEVRTLYGRGIGLTDAHLLASILMSRDCFLWTKDKRLGAAAKELRIHAEIA